MRFTRSFQDIFHRSVVLADTVHRSAKVGFELGTVLVTHCFSTPVSFFNNFLAKNNSVLPVSEESVRNESKHRYSPSNHSLRFKLFRTALGSWGGPGIKFLQWASVRSDLFNSDEIKALEKFHMHNSSDPFPFIYYKCCEAYGKATQLEDLKQHKKKLADISLFGRIRNSTFTSYVYSQPFFKKSQRIIAKFELRSITNKLFRRHSEPKPPLVCCSSISAGSIASVNKLLLPNEKKGYEEYIFKCITNDVLTFAKRDLLIFQTITDIADYFYRKYSDSFEVKVAADLFSAALQAELDFEHETQNLIKFNQNFRSVRRIIKNYLFGYRVKFPSHVSSWCSKNWMVQKYVKGDVLSGFYDNLNSKSKQKIAKALAHTYFTMLFQDNFIHADLHPGNIIVKHRSRLGNFFPLKFYLIDTGYTITLSPKNRFCFFLIMKNLIEQNFHLIGKYMVIHSSVNSSQQSENFIQDVEHLLNEKLETHQHKYQTNICDLNLVDCVFGMLKFAIKNNVSLSSELVNVGLSFTVIEGICRSMFKRIYLFPIAASLISRNYK